MGPGPACGHTDRDARRASEATVGPSPPSCSVTLIVVVVVAAAFVAVAAVVVAAAAAHIIQTNSSSGQPQRCKCRLLTASGFVLLLLLVVLVAMMILSSLPSLPLSLYESLPSFSFRTKTVFVDADEDDVVAAVFVIAVLVQTNPRRASEGNSAGTRSACLGRGASGSGPLPLAPESGTHPPTPLPFPPSLRATPSQSQFVAPLANPAPASPPHPPSLPPSIRATPPAADRNGISRA